MLSTLSGSAGSADPSRNLRIPIADQGRNRRAWRPKYHFKTPAVHPGLAIVGQTDAGPSVTQLDRVDFGASGQGLRKAGRRIREIRGSSERLLGRDNGVIARISARLYHE